MECSFWCSFYTDFYWRFNFANITGIVNKGLKQVIVSTVLERSVLPVRRYFCNFVNLSKTDECRKKCTVSFVCIFVYLSKVFITVLYDFISVWSLNLCGFINSCDRRRYSPGRIQVTIQERDSTKLWLFEFSHRVGKSFPKFRRKCLPPHCRWRQTFLPKHWNQLVRCGLRIQKVIIWGTRVWEPENKDVNSKTCYFHLY